MSDILPVILLLAVLVLVLAAAALLRVRSLRRKDPGETAGTERADGVQATVRDSDGGQVGITEVRQRRGGLSRMRRAAAAASEDRDDNDSPNAARQTPNGGGTAADAGDAGDQVTRRKKKKEANREAKREAQAARQAVLDAHHERQRAADEAREAEEALERAEAAEVAEAAREKAEAEARKEQEEYDNWKNLISVEDAGESIETDQLDDPALLQRFCDYVKNEKVVVLENIAAEFDLRTEDVVDRLTRLEENEIITGFFDDRGKFIYVSRDEMEQVAELIMKRGRISIQDLALESSKILRLDSLSTPAAT